jgi:SAM-dependent methyltransferase
VGGERRRDALRLAYRHGIASRERHRRGEVHVSEDHPRARASSSPDDDDIEVDAEEAPLSPRAARRARRAKAKLALRIPDDEVSRPQKPPKAEPPEPAKANGEAEPAVIKPTRIISVNPPPSPESEEATKRKLPSSPPTAPFDDEGSGIDVPVDEDDEVPTPMLPPVAPKTVLDAGEADIDVPVDEDEPEYRPRMQTLPSNPPPAPVEAEAKAVPKREPSGEELVIDDEVETPARPPVMSKPPAPPIPANALSSTPRLEDRPPNKARPPATALVDEEEARGIEEIEPDRASAPPPSVDSSDEVESAQVVAVEAKKAPPETKPISIPPKPAPPLPQKMISIVTPAAGVLSPLAPPALSEGLVPRRRARPWWEELFNDDFIRTIPKFTDAQVAAEVDFIEDSLGVATGGTMLDLGCGTGRHAIELTRRGYAVVGFDLSLALLARAGEEAQERNQKLNFVQGDMREMTFEDAFDGIFCWGSTFGFFEEEKNGQVIGRVHKALRHGGQLLLDVACRDFIIKQAPSLAWFEGEGCVCMDEMQVDWITSRMRVKRTMMLDDGRSKEIEYSIRIYSLHELGKLLHDQGFRVAEVSGRIQTPGVFFGPDSPRTLILAEKR